MPRGKKEHWLSNVDAVAKTADCILCGPVTMYRNGYDGKWKCSTGEKKRYQSNIAKKNLVVNGYKSRPCVDCGVSYPSYVMDFDHVRGVKSANVASLMRHPIEKIIE